MLYTQKLSAEVFLIFLKRLIAKRTRKLMWVVDRHPVHRSQAVQQWLGEHRDTTLDDLLATLRPAVESSRVSQL